jgi:hypothetical protein
MTLCADLLYRTLRRSDSTSADFCAYSHSLNFWDMFCTEFYPNRMKNIENKDEIQCATLRKVWSMILTGPDFTQICQEVWKMSAEAHFRPHVEYDCHCADVHKT